MSDSHYYSLRGSINRPVDQPNWNLAMDLQENNSTSSLTNAIGCANSGNPGELQHREIDYTTQLLDQIGSLLLNAGNADIILIVAGERLPAHRVILGTRSTYFGAMLYGGMRESTESEITLEENSAQAFKVLLAYIYTGKLQLHTMSLELALDLLALVHKYGFCELEAAIPEYLKSILCTRIVCQIYATAFLYSIESLVTACLDYIDNFALEILTTKGFLQLSAVALSAIISRNSFCAPEVEIFNAVRRWIKAHPDNQTAHEHVLSSIRFVLIKLSDLLNVVRPSGLILADHLLDTIETQSTTRSSDLHYRGFLLPDINVATAARNAKVITGDFKTALFATNADGNGGNAGGFGSERTYTRHSINPRDTSGITIELGRLFILNNIQLSLLDRDHRAYSYYVEISVDKNDWVRIIDRTAYLCRGYQNLYFQERVAKYIRVVGTQTTLPGPFHLVNFEAMYSTHPFELDGDSTLQVPHYNVATVKNNALVIEGVSRSRNALLNGDTKSYDWDDGYTCHQIGAGHIEIQLPQPYVVDSMKILLWDCDERVYSYYVEVSCDQIEWKKIADRENQRSWQTIHFEKMPIIFVKIVGTFNSANEVFHCVHFETPAISPDEDNVKSTRPSITSSGGESESMFGKDTDLVAMGLGTSKQFEPAQQQQQQRSSVDRSIGDVMKHLVAETDRIHLQQQQLDEDDKRSTASKGTDEGGRSFNSNMSNNSLSFSRDDEDDGRDVFACGSPRFD